MSRLLQGELRFTYRKPQLNWWGVHADSVVVTTMNAETAETAEILDKYCKLCELGVLCVLMSSPY